MIDSADVYDDVRNRLISNPGAWDSPPDFASDFLEWIQLYDTDQLASDLGWEYAIEPWSLNSSWLDSEVREYLVDLPEDVEITDEHRLEVSRYIINYSLNEDDLCDWKSVHAYPLPSRNSPEAYLGCTCAILGQAGPHYDFLGVFNSKHQILTHLQDSGAWLLSEIDKLDSKEILSNWNWSAT